MAMTSTRRAPRSPTAPGSSRGDEAIGAPAGRAKYAAAISAKDGSWRRGEQIWEGWLALCQSTIGDGPVPTARTRRHEELATAAGQRLRAGAPSQAAARWLRLDFDFFFWGRPSGRFSS
jgi:hypothetical protein